MRIIYLAAAVLLSACGGGGGSSAPASSTAPTAPAAPLSMSIDVSNVDFSERQHNNMPDDQSLTVTWAGGTSTAITAEYPSGTTGPDWLTITNPGGTSPVTIALAINSTDLAPGAYSTTFNVIATDTADSTTVTEAVDVNFNVLPSSESLRANSDRIVHFGQEVILNGANIAWSAEPGWFNQDIGAADATGTPQTNIAAFEGHFQTLKNAGGNSARIWLHTGATVTPNIEADGTVSGLSAQLTNDQVVEQLDAILDAAWEENVLVTFTLFSFNMICSEYTPAKSKDMLENHLDTYVENALIPMVEGLKDHPALLAWEIFNEPEGMEFTDYFCPSTLTVTTETVQRVVNQTAAAIHKADPNVKVTTSTHTEIYDRYANSTLLALSGADPAGTLDFYALHWYNTGWQASPFTVTAAEYNADRPIIMGEYDVEGAGTGGPSADNAVRTILTNGYLGSWPWSLTTGNVPAITSAISNASDVSTAIDKTAIEACLLNRPDSCYID